MKVQDYAPPKLTLGIVGIVAAIIPILVGYFLVSGMATSANYTSAFAGPTSSTTVTTSSAVAGVSVAIPAGASNPANAPGYSPDKITVVIGVNSTVTWTNDDTAAHTVTSNNVTNGAAVFDSGNLAAGQSFTYSFTTPGTYTYKCDYHSWMSGTVVVKKGTAAVAISIPAGAGSPSGAPGYSPDKVTLVVGVNNTVTWTNDDTAGAGTHHTVTSTSVPSGASSFNSGDLAPGATFTYTFTIPGTYSYDCSYHSWMMGTITVVAG